ncbi:hypothetical protein ACHAWF_017627 [Thalassiosira exigua]
MAQFRFKSQRSLPGGARAILPEEGTDLHNHFRTCPSLTRIREEFRSAMTEGSGGNARSGKNVCARAERGTGQLLLHSIGSNGELVTSGGGGTAAAQSRINQFVLKELLPAYPAAMIEEDDKGHIPFTEPIIRWIQARRAVRKWKIDTDMTREKVALVAAKLNKKIGVAAVTRGMDGKQARTELKMIVDSANDAMFCIDEKGKILLTNRMAQQTFGYSKKEMLGGNISMICNKKDAEHHGEYLERYLRTGEKRVMGKKRELLARRKDGSTFFIELGLTEVNMGGGHLLFCGFVKDATDVRRHRSSLECGLNGSKDQEVKGDQAIQARGIPPLVEWCLQILSEFVDTYGFIGHQTGHEADDDFDDDSSSDGSILRSSLQSSLQGRSFRSMRNLGGDISQAMHDTIVVEKLASIPHLLEELLLIEDSEARNRVFDMSIVHKVLFNVESLDDGQCIKVQKQKVLDANLTGSDIDTVEARAFQRQLQMAHDQCRVLAESAVFYLEQVSSLNIQDDLHVFHNMQMHRELTSGGMADMISTGDVRHFENRRNELFDAVGEAKGLIRRICVLEDDLVKRAAATPVIRRLLDKIMFSPFATLSALFDGINHLLLMISFRLGPAPAVFYLAKNNDAFKPQQYLIASIGEIEMTLDRRTRCHPSPLTPALCSSLPVLTASVSYFGTKAIHQNLAKRNVSENLFWADAFNFWSLLDIIPLLIVFVCSVAVDIVLRARAHSDSNDGSVPFFLRAAIALTTPFLWLRIMAFIKVRNKQLATFILCSVEIMKDIKWFLLVLFAAMASFAQMWVSFTLEPNEAESQHYMEGYFKAYTMMLGDLDSEALRIHPLIAILFVLYTFGVTIVLLNILIAIVSDSYQNSFVSSKMMLGKARVMFVSDLLNQRTFHDMWMAGKAGTTRKHVRRRCSISFSRFSHVSRSSNDLFASLLFLFSQTNYVFGTVAAVHIWMVTRTIIAKQCQVELCEVDTLSPSRVRLEAIFAFTASVFMIYSMKACIVYVLNEFNDTGCAKSSDSRKSSGVQRALNWFVNNAFSALSKSFDSLFDREDSHKEIGHSPAAREYRTDKAIQRSIEKTKKHLKSELKGMFEQMQLSIKELEEENKKDIAKIEDFITTAIVDSHDLLLNAIQNQDGTVREQISVEDEESESSQYSLSMDDIDSRRSSLETGDR